MTTVSDVTDRLGRDGEERLEAIHAKPDLVYMSRRSATRPAYPPCSKATPRRRKRTLRRLLTTTASIETGAFAGNEERLESIHADPTNHLSLKQAGSLDLEGARSASAIAHHRSRRLPSTHPTSAIMPIAMLYQVATKSGLSSVQCMAYSIAANAPAAIPATAPVRRGSAGAPSANRCPGSAQPRRSSRRGASDRLLSPLDSKLDGA